MKPVKLKLLNGAIHYPLMVSMLRGEIWWVSFSGSVGGEVQKIRPAVIISNNAANLHANRVQIVPLSGKIEKLFPCEAKVMVGGQLLKAMADQLTTVAKERCTSRIGVLSASDLHGVEMAVRLQLGLIV